MSHVLKTLIGFLLILHLGALFVVTRHSDAKVYVRRLLALKPVSEEPLSSSPKKPKIPLRILSPASQEEWAYNAGRLIPLTANQPARWMVDQEYIGEGKTVFWPLAPGTHFVRAVQEDWEQSIYIFIK